MRISCLPITPSTLLGQGNRKGFEQQQQKEQKKASELNVEKPSTALALATGFPMREIIPTEAEIIRIIFPPDLMHTRTLLMQNSYQPQPQFNEPNLVNQLV